MQCEMTPAEKRLWHSLRGAKLGRLHLRRQQIIDGFIVDFYCHATGLIVEVDGLVHQDREGNGAERDAILGIRGLRVLRIPNERVFCDLDAVLRDILAAAGD
jgi:very-short-patch-repair endonuclease